MVMPMCPDEEGDRERERERDEGKESYDELDA